jgi:hypothetical protein
VVTVCSRINWPLSIHGEKPSLALETHREDRRGAAVAEMDEVAKSRSLKSRSRIWGLWLQVVDPNGDALGSEKEAMANYGWTAPYHLS